MTLAENNSALSAASPAQGDKTGPSAHKRRSSLTANVFSFPVMCMFLLGAVIFAFCVKQFAEPDIWWHLRDGAYLLGHHSFPNVDTYSFGAAGAPWMDLEWLSEVFFFAGFKAAGLRGILAVYFLVLLLIYTGVYYRSCRAGADCKDATLATLLALFLGVVSIGPRTLLFGWLCMVGLLIVLDRFQQTGKGIWLLPPLFALWINLHASWPFGMVVLALVIVSGLVEGEWGLVVARRWSAKELRSLLLALGASVAALFVNPFGYKLVLYPLDFLVRQQSNMKYVEEWQSVDFSSGNGKLALLVIFGVLAAALFSRRRWRLDEVLLTAFALWAGLSHARFLFFLGLIVMPVLAPHLQLFTPYEREADKPWLNAAIVAAVVAAVIFLFPSSAKLQAQVDAKYPTAALEFMQQHHLEGRTFNQYLWGGYMEWKTPDLKPIIDGRADIFVYNGVLDDHRRAMTIQAPLEIMDKYRIDYALLQPEQPLTYLLQHSASWRTIYADKVAVLLEHIPASAVVRPARVYPNY
ncbi:MAG TPA: hypothetical protein VKV05_11465 [Terriglobales bacterium]|nr:hypothetical protein [Terriglobales bacterium]